MPACSSSLEGSTMHASSQARPLGTPAPPLQVTVSNSLGASSSRNSCTLDGKLGFEARNMTRMDIDELRVRYEAAFEVYRRHTVKLIERSKGGQQPSPQELVAEEEALHEFTRLRRELLDAVR